MNVANGRPLYCPLEKPLVNHIRFDQARACALANLEAADNPAGDDERSSLNRLHDTARRDLGWGTQQQMNMVKPHVALQNLDVLTATNLPIRSRRLRPMSPLNTGLRSFVVNTKW